MATTKITDLTAYTDPVNTDVLPIVDVTSDVTKKVSIANVMKNASLGSASLPGVSFDGDPNTGIYSPGADQVAVTTGGTQRLLIDSSGAVTIAGDLTVNGTTTNINTTNLVVEDKNIVLGDVTSPTDVTADGGGITLKGTTDKTLNWVDATDAWTSSEHVNIASGKEYRIAGTKVLDATSLGSAVLITSANITNGTIVNEDINASAAIDKTKISGTAITAADSGTVTSTMIADGTIVNADINASAAIDKTKISGTAITAGDSGTVTSTMIADGTILNGDINASAAIAGTKISPDFGSQNTTTTGTSTAASFIPSSSTAPTNGLYLPAANSVALATGGSGRLFIDSSGNVGVGSTPNAYAGNTTFTVGNATGSVIDWNIAGTRTGTVAVTASQMLVGSAASVPVIFQSANTERLRITSAGLVGIGTSSPSGLFHVSGGRTILSSSDGYELAFARTGNYFYFYNDGGNITGKLSLTTTIGAGGEIITFTQDTKRVGIGTTAPLTTFHARTSAVTGYSSVANDGAVIERSGGTCALNIVSDSTQNGAIWFADGNAATQGGVVYSHSSDALYLQTNNAERARIDSSGRLLVGTSSAQGTSILQVCGNSTASTDGGNLRIIRGLNVSNIGANVGAQIGVINFGTLEGTICASIESQSDATWSSTSDTPGRLVFSTTADGASSPTERCRITEAGELWINRTSRDSGVGSDCKLQVLCTTGEWATIIRNSNASPFGLRINYDTDANGTSNQFLTCIGGTTTRANIRSNGGLANYSANNVNLSDRNVKKDIAPAAGTWDCLKEWEIVNFRYKDQAEDADLNMGVIAQQVAESCPEVIQVFQEAKEATETEPAQEERIGVKEQQMMWMAIKALQEAQLRIETLEAEVAALKGA